MNFCYSDLKSIFKPRRELRNNQMTFTIITLNHVTIVDSIPAPMREDEVVNSWLIDLINLKCVQLIDGHTVITTLQDIQNCTLTQKRDAEYGNILIMRCELYTREVLELRFKNYGIFQLLNPEIQFLTVTGQQRPSRAEDWWYDTKYQWDYISTKIKTK